MEARGPARRGGAVPRAAAAPARARRRARWCWSATSRRCKRRDRALLSKDATIREIHHRVKNNLQTVAALLRLQARRTTNPEARDALEESVRRVTSIALVHETLSVSVDERVDLDELLDQVLPMLSRRGDGRDPGQRAPGGQARRGAGGIGDAAGDGAHRAGAERA